MKRAQRKKPPPRISDVIHRDIERRKEAQKASQQFFNNIKPKRITYKHGPNMENQFVYLSKKVLNRLIGSEYAVYPAMACLSNNQKDGWFQMSQDNIAEYSGVNKKYAIKALKSLSHDGLITRKKINVGRVITFRYRVDSFYRAEDLDTVEVSDCMQFYHSLIMTGIWKQLSLDSKRLYFRMREIASFDYQIYLGEEYDSEIPDELQEDLLLDGHEIDDWINQNYATRPHDSIATENYEAMDWNLRMGSGISETRLPGLLKELERVGLVRNVSSGPSWYIYLVRLKPKSLHHLI